MTSSYLPSAEGRAAAAELDRLRARIAELERGVEEYACTGTDMPCGCYELLSKEKELRALAAGLLAALEPFAKMADQVDNWQKGSGPCDTSFDADDLRKARAAIANRTF